MTEHQCTHAVYRRDLWLARLRRQGGLGERPRPWWKILGAAVRNSQALPLTKAVQMLEQQRQQDAGHLTGRPHGSVEHFVVAGVVALVAAAHDAERRGHGALARGQDAPTSSSWAFCQACPRPRPGVGLVNSVAKGTSRDTMASGRVSMVRPFSESGVRPAYPVFMLFLNFAESPGWTRGLDSEPHGGKPRLKPSRHLPAVLWIRL